MPQLRFFQYQVTANPIPIVATPPPSFDYATPWSIPSRLKTTISAALIAASGLTWCPFTPAAAVDVQVSYTSETVLSRKYLIYQEQTDVLFVEPATVQFFNAPHDVFYSKYFIYQDKVEPVSVAETVTVDKWFEPFINPSRKRLPVPQQYLAYTPFTAETVTVDKWLVSWCEPPKRKSLLLSQQQFLAFQYPVAAVAVPFSYSETAVPYSKYFFYQSITEVPSVERVTVDKWLASLSEPSVKTRRPVAQQQYLAWGYTTPEVATLDKWYASWRDPVKVKLGLKASAQPFIAHAPFDEVSRPDKWFVPWSEPLRAKAGLRPSAQQFLALQPFPYTEILTVDKWFAPLVDPARVRRFSTALQSFSAYSPFVAEDVTVDKWFAPWREPVRVKIGLASGAQQFLAHAPFEEQRTVDKWFVPWHDPVRVKLGLKTSAQQFLALQPFPYTETFTVDKWFAPWREPIRVRNLATSAQSFIAHAPFNEIVTVDKWFALWRDPVRVKLGLGLSAQQFLALQPFTETVTVDKWFASWREPVRVKSGLKPSAQQFIAWSGFTPSEIVTLDKWYATWREPVRVKAGLRTAAQQYFAWGYSTPVVQVTQSSWYQAWSEPPKREFILPSQQQVLAFESLAWGGVLFSYSPQIIPYTKYLIYQTKAEPPFAVINNITIDLDATEIGDGFSGRINVIYCFHSLVSIVEIPVPDQADVAATVPVATFASVSINEVRSIVVTSVSIIETC